MPCSCFWWEMQRFEQVRRKPQLFVFERSEEFCAAGASPYRPVPRIAPDTQKTAQQGCLLLWWGIQRIEQPRAQALGYSCSEHSGELCRACGKPLPSPAPHYFRYIKTAQNGRSFAWSFFRLSRRFSRKDTCKKLCRGKNRSKYNRNAVSLTLRHASDLVPKGTPAPDTSIAGYRRRRSSARQTRERRRIPLLPCRTILP
mgnify:CR=1 FL=1